MHDCIYFVFCKDLVQIGSIAQVSLVKTRLGVHSFPVPCSQGIQDNDLVTALCQGMHIMRPDIACTAYHKNTHVFSFFFNAVCKCQLLNNIPDKMPQAAYLSSACCGASSAGSSSPGSSSAASVQSTASSGAGICHSDGCGAVSSALSPRYGLK